MAYVSGDGRELIVNEFNFGDYEIAYALCSNGDVIENFYDGNVLSILLADTMGHDKETGDSFKRYLDRVRKSGWGFGDAESEISYLSKNFPRGDSEFDTSEWNPAGGFIRLEKGSDLVQIVNAGIEKPLIFCNGVLKTLDLRGSLEFYDKCERTPSYNGNMNVGDVIVLQSDGIFDNLERFSDVGREYYERIVKHNSKPLDIVSRVVDPQGFGRYCLPQDDRYDDISILVVKKN